MLSDSSAEAVQIVMKLPRFLPSKRILCIVLLISFCVFYKYSRSIHGHIQESWVGSQTLSIKEQDGLNLADQQTSHSTPKAVSVDKEPEASETTPEADATKQIEPFTIKTESDARNNESDTAKAESDTIETPTQAAKTKIDVKQPVSDSQVSPEKAATTGGLVSVDYWDNLDGFLVDHLRMDSRFPGRPTMNKMQHSLDYNIPSGNTAVKMYGYLKLPETGQYRFGLVSSNASELWISSDHQPQNLRKVACVACIDQQNLPARVHPPKPKTFTTDADASLALLPNVELSVGKMYYFEVYLKTARDSKGYVSTKWKTPNTNEWKAIPATAFGALDGEQSKTSSSSPLPSHRPQHPLRVYYSGNELVDSVVLKEVLPECDYRPKYAYEHHVPRYEGYKEVCVPSVYPDDHTDLKSRHHEWFHGNPLIPIQRCQLTIGLYKAALTQSQYGERYKDMKVTLLEENANILHSEHDGWRYLLEAEIYWKDTDKPTYISEYVYRSEKDPAKKLCSVRGHQWNRTAKVHMLLPVKNQGKWVVHSLRNLEDIYLTTGDTNFVLTFIDFESTDINIAEVLENTRLPKDMIKLINMKGPFSRTSSLQAGIDSPDVKTNDIILTADLHLTFPSGYIQTARKHTIQGRMGYAPTFVRLDQGLTEYDISSGFWEQMGFGQIAMCKSDFIKIGGMNTEEFKFKWGGEDWEVTDRIRSNGYELFRLRYPSFVHYFHSRAGMWSN